MPISSRLKSLPSQGGFKGLTRMSLATLVLANFLLLPPPGDAAPVAPPRPPARSQSLDRERSLAGYEIVPSETQSSVNLSLEELGGIPRELKRDSTDQVTTLVGEVKPPWLSDHSREKRMSIRSAVLGLSSPPGTKPPAKEMMRVFVKDLRDVWVNSDKVWDNCYLRDAVVRVKADTLVVWLSLRAFPKDRVLEITAGNLPEPTGRSEVVVKAWDSGNSESDRMWKTVPTLRQDGPPVFRVQLSSRLAFLPGPDSESCPWNNQEAFIADYVSIDGDGEESLAGFKEIELRQYVAEQPDRRTHSRWTWRQELRKGLYKYLLVDPHKEIHPSVALKRPTFDFGPAMEFDVCAIPKGEESRTDRWEVLRTLTIAPDSPLTIDPFTPERRDDAINLDEFSGIGLRPQLKPCRGFAAMQGGLESDPVVIDVAACLRQTTICVRSNIDGRAVPKAVASGRFPDGVKIELPSDSLGFVRSWYWYGRGGGSSECFFPVSNCEVLAAGYRQIPSARPVASEPPPMLEVLMQPNESRLRLKLTSEERPADRAPLPDRVALHFPTVSCLDGKLLEALDLNVRIGETVRTLGGRPFHAALSGQADSLFEIVSVAGTRRAGPGEHEPAWPLSGGDDSITVVVRARLARAVLPYRIGSPSFPTTPPEVTAWTRTGTVDPVRRGQWPGRAPLSDTLVIADLDATARSIELAATAPPELDDLAQMTVPVRFSRGRLVPADPQWALVFEPRKPATILLVEACDALTPAWDDVRDALEAMIADGGRPCQKLLIGLAQEDQRTALPATGAGSALREYRVSNLAVPRSDENLKWAANEARKIDPRRPELPCRLIYVIPSEPVLYKLWLGDVPPFDPKQVELYVIEIGFPSSSVARKGGVARSFVEANRGTYKFVADPDQFALALREFTGTD